MSGEAWEEAEPTLVLQDRGLERKLVLGVGLGLGPTQLKVRKTRIQKVGLEG